MWLIALAIIIAGVLIAKAIYDKGRQKRIDDWYDNLPPEEKEKYEKPAEFIFDENVVKGFEGDAKKIYKLKKQGKTSKEIAKAMGTPENYVKKIINSSIYKRVNKL